MPGVKAISFYQNHSLVDKPDMTKSSSKVCRCLFGKPDHDKLRKDLDRELESDRLRGMTRWNFDFTKNSPLEGKYQWDIVSSDYVPEFYSRPSRPSKVGIQRTERVAQLSNTNNETSDDEELAIPLIDTVCSENSLNAPKTVPTGNTCTDTPASSTRGTNLVQRRIDDYMKRRKRRLPNTDTSSQSTKSPRTE